MTYRKGNLGKLRHAGEEIWESYGLRREICDSYGLQERDLWQLWPTGEKYVIVITYGREIQDSFGLQERNIGQVWSTGENIGQV